MARKPSRRRKTSLSEVLRGGDPEKVAALIADGSRIRFCDEHGYDALLHAVHGRDICRDERLLELLRLLVENEVELSGISTYRESGLRVLSNNGRFDAVQLLLEAGADFSHLLWTPLIQAVAIGTLDEVSRLLGEGAPLEEREWWERTAWLVAIQTGDLDKARLLRDSGADLAASGRCGKLPLFYAIESHHPAMLRWLLEIGLDPEQTDGFGVSGLIKAVESDDLECVHLLLEAGARIDRIQNGSSALGRVRSREIAVRLLDAGADPAGLSNEGRRLLVGLPPDPDESALESLSLDEFRRARTRRFGDRNPEEVREPFWEAMVRAGVSGYVANEILGGPSSFGGEPVWCAQRFGQSLTRLPDGRIVLIGGEHEDYYDPDFCIYNDVFVHEPGGKIRILSYPESVFPPTDFHTATRVGEVIYLIGSLGYVPSREEETPVFRLPTHTFQIERVIPGGESPGWIHGHRAKVISEFEILVWGGTVIEFREGKQVECANARHFVLDLAGLRWRPASVGERRNALAPPPQP